MEDLTLFLWLTAAVFALLLEMTNPGLFYFLSFFFGCLAGCLAAWGDFSLLAQGISFLASAALSFLLLRLWLKKNQTGHFHKTNVDALQGKKGIVIKKINPDKPGQVTVESEVWSARPVRPEVIEVGAHVEVIRVSGSHVIVDAISGKK